jgi:hypothetical protein
MHQPLVLTRCLHVSVSRFSFSSFLSLAPLKSLEQLGPMFVFIALQFLSFFNYFYDSQSDQGTNPKKFETFVKRVLGAAATLFAVGMSLASPWIMLCGRELH